jgi:hypothetical protein
MYLADGPRGAPGTSLLPATVTAAATPEAEWVVVDLADQEVLVEDAFYVALQWVTTAEQGVPRIGVDWGAPDRRTWWLTATDGLWRRIEAWDWEAADPVPWDIDADAMIRVTLGP